MAPDDAPVPNDDAIARAARRGLGDLASSDAPGELSWDGVQSGVRRVQRRRVAAIGVACAVLLVGMGIAVAATSGTDDHLRVNGKGAPATTSPPPPTTTTTSIPELPTTTLPRFTGPSGVLGTTTTVPGPTSLAPGIVGTVTVATTTWVAEQPESFTLTVQNTNTQEYRFGPENTLGIYVGTAKAGGCMGVDHADLVLAPGEQRTYTGDYTPRPEMIGTADIGAANLWAGDNYSNCLSTDGFGAVPTVRVTIIPPGWTAGQPLDPTQGKWRATLSADSPNLTLGETTAIHVDVANLWTETQSTAGYGALAVVCTGPGIYDGYPVPIGSTTIEPRTTQRFTVDFPADQITGPGTYVCSLGITIHGVPNWASADERIDTNSLGIFVTSTDTTTTTVPVTTTAPTTP